jgi:hypothetical protein
VNFYNGVQLGFSAVRADLNYSENGREHHDVITFADGKWVSEGVRSQDLCDYLDIVAQFAQSSIPLYGKWLERKHGPLQTSARLLAKSLERQHYFGGFG